MGFPNGCGKVWKFGSLEVFASFFLDYTNREGGGRPLDRLVRRRTSIVGPFCCILCWKAEEDLDHLLWECQYAQAVWSFFLQELDVSLAGQKLRGTIEEFLLHLPFREKCCF